MYGGTEYDNNYELMRLAQASRKATEGWRFRHHKGRESRMLSDAWAGVKALVCKMVGIKEPSIAPARKRLSYRGVCGHPSEAGRGISNPEVYCVMTDPGAPPGDGRHRCALPEDMSHTSLATKLG